MRTFVHIAAFGVSVAVFFALGNGFEFWSPALALFTLALACAGMWFYWQKPLDMVAAIASGIGTLGGAFGSTDGIGLAVVAIGALIAFVCCFPSLFGWLLASFFEDGLFD